MKSISLHIAFFLALSTASTAYGKSATIEWKSFKLAVQYHLQIRRGTENVVDTKLDKQATRWNGSLDPGLYEYRIRVYDRVGRPGKWSQFFPMAVKPDAPQAALIDNAQMYPDADGSIVLEWQDVPNVDGYRVVILRNKKPIYRKTVKDSRAVIGRIPPGNYAWQVQGVLKNSTGKRGPASLKTTAGDMSRPLNFFVKEYLYIPRARLGIFSGTGPYDYQTAGSHSGQVSALGMASGLRGDLWVSDHLSFDLGWESQFLKVEGSSITLNNQHLLVNYTPLRATGSSRWEFTVGAGAELKEMLRLLSSSGNYAGADRRNILGVRGLLRVRRFFSRNFIGAFEASHFFGLTDINSQSTFDVNAARPLGNVTVKLTGQLLLSNTWDLEVSLLGQRSNVVYTGGGLSSAQTVEHLQARANANLNFRF